MFPQIGMSFILITSWSIWIPIEDEYSAQDFLWNVCQGKCEETIKECTKALELNPTYNKALVRRAEAHEKLEHFEDAVTGEFMSIYLPCMQAKVFPFEVYSWNQFIRKIS